MTDAILDHCAARTAEYDRDDGFFTEDFDELRSVWPSWNSQSPSPRSGPRSLCADAPMAYHPMTQYSMAEKAIELENTAAYVERIASEWSIGVDHGMAWPAKLVAAKFKAVEGAKRVVDLAMDVSGGAGMCKSNELERIYRDVRCGGFHPANSGLVHGLVRKSAGASSARNATGSESSLTRAGANAGLLPLVPTHNQCPQHNKRPYLLPRAASGPKQLSSAGNDQSVRTHPNARAKPARLHAALRTHPIATGALQ